MNNVKGFDSEKSVVVDFTRVTKKKKSRKEELVVSEVSKKSIPYIIFSFQHISNKYNIDYKKIAFLLYLHELKYFKNSLIVSEKKMILGELISLGFVHIEYSVKNNIYSLTETGRNIVVDFYEYENDRSTFYLENRQTDIDVESKVKSVLKNLFNQKY